MTKLSDLLAIEDANVKQATLKKMFMPYTENVSIDGFEKEALTILLNLSSSYQADRCSNWLDVARAKNYLQNIDNLDASLAEIKWFHTHNLKFPDCRVKGQRIIAKALSTSESFISSVGLDNGWGWSHNSAFYRHPIWLLNPFSWRSKSVSVLSLIQEENQDWLSLLQEFGLTVTQLAHIQNSLLVELRDEIFPNSVSAYSKQLRFPWRGDYVSITPVVSHAMQRELELRSRNKESKLRFVSSSLPNSASIGNLCGSLGGHIKVLDYPLGVKSNLNKTLNVNRQKSGRYFDDYQVTNSRICQVLNHLIGVRPLKTKKQRERARLVQSRILRKQIALWMLPLLELRDIQDAVPNRQQLKHDDSLAQAFLTLPASEFPSLANDFNRHLHFVFQENRFTAKFAYHPNLMSVAKAQISWLLEELSQPSEPQELEPAEQYIYLSFFRVQDAIAMSSPYLSGIPSMAAFWGFMHQYQREFNQLVGGDCKFEFSSFSLYVRSENIKPSAKLSEPNSVAKKRVISNAKRPTILGQRLSDLEIDLIIRVESQNRISDFLSELKAALPVVLAGGSVFQPLISSQIDWLKTFSSKSELFHVLKGEPANGRWLFPSETQPQSFDELEQLLSGDSNRIPISIGYHLLEYPTARDNSLTERHAYAENALGIAKRLNPIDVRFGGRDHFFNHAFWSLEYSGEAILIKKLRD
ncbi:type I-F CRISPR-associated protein Csy2 [Vibrio penaeicida]|nr:type I-F CRISPR-associated protein Csy2 [Vibrio penaeicida]RTZ23090.1 hypothetical protein EKN09_10800 [Vibrio penaeicida]